MNAGVSLGRLGVVGPVLAYSVVWACILCGSMALIVLVVLLACRPLAFNGKLF